MSFHPQAVLEEITSLHLYEFALKRSLSVGGGKNYFLLLSSHLQLLFAIGCFVSDGTPLNVILAGKISDICS